MNSLLPYFSNEVFKTTTKITARRQDAHESIIKWEKNLPHSFNSFHKCIRSSLFYNTQVSDTSDTSATRTVWVRRECYTNDTSAIRVKKFDFDNNTSENIYFSHPCISKWEITRKRTISFSELAFGNVSFPCQNAFEKCKTKTELCNGKSYIIKLYTRL